MSSSLEKKLLDIRQKVLKPAPKMNLVEWADTYRFLSPESSSTPGKWRTSLVEPARGPMLAVTEPGVKRISIMASTQLLKSEILNNIIGYFISNDPCPIILMQPTVSLAETFSRDRLDPMLRDTPILRGLVKDKKSRDSGNTLHYKKFPGGGIYLIGSNSPSELASRPIRVVLRDEIDKYVADSKEGDPSSLIAERAATFWNSLNVGVCSPTIKGRSAIESEYLNSDQRKYFVDCPHCNFSQVMQWENVRWDKDDPSTAAYQCIECTALWSEIDRLKVINKGRYIATQPFNGHAGFWVNKLASPWEPLSALVNKYLACGNDQDKLKTFVNTQLAQTWEEKGEAPEHMRLYERRELYEIGSVPEGVYFLTAGADVQKDRIELEIVGWGKGKETWSIDYRVIMGETTTDEPWKKLDEILNESWECADGRMVQIKALAIDSGYNTNHVYNWCRKYSANRVMPVKGNDAQQIILSIPKAADVKHSGKKVSNGVRVWTVGVSLLKTELYGYLNLNGAGDDGIYPSGYCHFPQYSEEYFRMLTAEQLMKRQVNGKTTYVWVKTYERNEALDCRNYARAAANMIGIDRFKDKDWLNFLGEVKAKPKLVEQKQPDRKSYTNKPNPFLGGKKSFWDRS